MYKVLNYFFFIFHAILVIFILSGWVFTKTRKYHLRRYYQLLFHGLYWEYGMAGDTAFAQIGIGE